MTRPSIKASKPKYKSRQGPKISLQLVFQKRVKASGRGGSAHLSLSPPGCHGFGGGTGGWGAVLPPTEASQLPHTGTHHTSPKPQPHSHLHPHTHTHFCQSHKTRPSHLPRCLAPTTEPRTCFQDPHFSFKTEIES